ncbi:uncharacterized protein LOC117170913 [Belonocnema kinseyi]|uniref:uncharacterized protein LOC117170913 n=1 Tax=Belonocnema kinseyi TaxID=2817044 RepID=UPI00143D37C4|nr:uncharacterized protein LOC117170913 [Belonocnema kinseyi]
MAFLDFMSATRRRHAETLQLPSTFSGMFPTYIYIQKKNGAIYFGYVNKYGRGAPEWTKNREFIVNNAVEDVFVKMPNGINYIALIHPSQNVTTDNEHRREHRCFILYEGSHILVTDLQPVNEIRRPITSPIGIQVRMPDEHNRHYLGGLEHYNGPRLNWFRLY